MKGVRRIMMDGVEIPGQLLRAAAPGQKHNVLVEMG